MAAQDPFFRPAARNLALCFQEALTVVVRLRAGRHQVHDADAFREQFKQTLQTAEQEARRQGYSAELARQGIFSIVALLDETILNSQISAFSGWGGRPLQQEMFGVDLAGEVFFKGAERLLATDDSHELADVLEVYYLCLLLGYGGRYSSHKRGDLQNITETVGRRIYRIRGDMFERPLSAALPTEQTPGTIADPWIRKLQYVAVGTAVLVGALVVVYLFFLSSLGGTLEETVARVFGA